MADEWRTYIRLPAELRDRIEQAATENRRSITQEILYRLERDVREHDKALAKVS